MIAGLEERSTYSTLRPATQLVYFHSANKTFLPGRLSNFFADKKYATAEAGHTSLALKSVLQIFINVETFAEKMTKLL